MLICAVCIYRYAISIGTTHGTSLVSFIWKKKSEAIVSTWLSDDKDIVTPGKSGPIDVLLHALCKEI
jgi:hypothetical protein